MSTSVVIATFDRAALLDQCLRHIAAQRFEPGDEVIVVDNGSADDTAAVVARHASRFPVPLRYLLESRPGKSHALAAALAVARGEILAFTDDDVNVAVNWLEAIRSAMAAPDVALVGGPVAPRWERRAPGWLRLSGPEYGRLAAPIALLNYGDQPVDLGPRTVLGANLAVRRAVLESVGGFATHLGKLRGTLLSGEDHDLCRRVQAAGFRAAYSPSVLVQHWVPADRLRVGYFVRWFFWSGITNAALDQAGERPSRAILGVPAHLIRRAAGGMLGAVGAAACGRFAAAMDHIVDTAFVAGYTAKCLGVVALAPPARPTAGEAA